MRLIPHPDDLAKRQQWPTEVWAREGTPAERANRHLRNAPASAGETKTSNEED